MNNIISDFIIYSPTVAAKLLLKKCKMTMARPDEQCPTKTIFIFKVNENLMTALDELNIKY
jgi:hypothetical protein